MNLINVIDTIDTVRDATQKAEHVLWLFGNTFSSRELHDPLGIMRNIRTAYGTLPSKWSDDEKQLLDWVGQCNEIMTSISIVTDYVGKITDALKLIPDATICEACDEARATV